MPTSNPNSSPFPTPPPPGADDDRAATTQIALLRQAFEFSVKVLVDGQTRIETSVGSLRDEVARNYVDKVEHQKLESRVGSVEGKATSIDAKVGTLTGYMGWAVKTIIGLVFVAIAGLLFAKGGVHP